MTEEFPKAKQKQLALNRDREIKKHRKSKGYVCTHLPTEEFKERYDEIEWDHDTKYAKEKKQ